MTTPSAKFAVDSDLPRSSTRCACRNMRPDGAGTKISSSSSSLGGLCLAICSRPFPVYAALVTAITLILESSGAGRCARTFCAPMCADVAVESSDLPRSSITLGIWWLSRWSGALRFEVSFGTTFIWINTQFRMSGNFIYDVFMGWPVDLKMWAEVRIPWVLVFFMSVSGACKQYEDYGYVTPVRNFLTCICWAFIKS